MHVHRHSIVVLLNLACVIKVFVFGQVLFNAGRQVLFDELGHMVAIYSMAVAYAEEVEA